MYPLLANENLKIYSRVRTWVLAALVLVAIGLTGWVLAAHPSPVSANWKASLRTTDASLKKEIAEDGARMPRAVVEQLKSQIAVNQYYIAHNLAPGRETGWTFARTAENIVSVSTVFVLVIAGDIVASEFAGGTIKMLLTQPVSRTRILLAKYVAVLLFGLFLLAFTLAISVLIGGLLFGFHGANAPFIYVNDHATLERMPSFLYLLVQYGFNLVTIVMTVTIAFMISTIFRSSAIAITISVLVVFVGSTLVAALSRYHFVKYILFTNMNLSQYMQNGPIVKGMTLEFSVFMLIAYFVVLNFLSWLFFVKRDVAV